VRKRYLKLFGVLAIATSILSLPAQAQEKKLDRPVKFGIVSALSGDAAAFGKPFVDAIKVAIDELNARGGLLGQPIEMIAYDDRGVPDLGLQVAKKLVLEDHVDTLQPGSTSGVIFTAMPVGKDQKVAMWGYGLAEQWLVEGEGMIFRSASSDKVRLTALAKYAHDQLALKKVGVLYIDNFYGQSARDVFKAAYKSAGNDVATEVSHNEGARDISSQLLQLRTKGLDGIFVATTGAGFGPLVRQVRQFLPKNVVVMTDAQSADPKIRAELGASANGIVYAGTPMVPQNTDPLSQEWIARLKEKTGLYQEIMSRAVTGVLVMADAIKRAGTVDPIEVMKAVHHTRGLATPVGTYTYDPRDGEGLKTALVMKAADSPEKDEILTTVRIDEPLYEKRLNYDRFFGPDYTKSLYEFHNVQ